MAPRRRPRSLPRPPSRRGWAAAELGRQPWIVYELLKTADAISKVVPAGQIATTLGDLRGHLRCVLFVGWARIFFGIIARGPDESPATAGVREPVPLPVAGSHVRRGRIRRAERR